LGRTGGRAAQRLGVQLQVAGHQGAADGGRAEVEVQLRLLLGLHLHRLATQGPQQGHQIVRGHRIAAENLRRGRLPIGAGAEQILHRPLAAIGQLGEGEAELLEDRDAGIVAVEITPLITAEAPQELQRLSPQPGVVQGGMGGGIEGDGGGWAGHDHQRWLFLSAGMALKSAELEILQSKKTGLVQFLL